MKGFSGAAGVAVLGGLVALCAPFGANAGNVGHFKSCGWGGSSASTISAAGHTPVLVTSLDSESLAPLDGLVISQCNAPYTGNAAVDSAVSGGLRLMIDIREPPLGSALPGDPMLTFDGRGLCADVSITTGAPIATGPGGTLTASSLDNAGICGGHGSVTTASLPAGGQSLVHVANYPDSAVAFAYPTGSGLVAASFSQWMGALPGGAYSGSALAPGVLTFYTNTVAWMMSAELTPPTTCASEGYTGTKLEWCKNICERGYEGSTLAMWIRRWTDRYRTLPYCAVAPQPALR